VASRRSNRIAGQFDARLIEMLESPAYRVASLSCRMILDRIAIEHAHHGGKDNGKLPVTFDDFVDYGVHRQAVSPALAEGEALGLFFITEHGRAGIGDFRSSNKFRMAHRPVGNEEAGNEWNRIKTIKAAKAIAKTARAPWRRPAKRDKRHHRPSTMAAIS